LVKDGAVVFREDEIAVEWPYSVHFPEGSDFFYTPQTAVFRACFQKKGPDAARSHFVLLPVESLPIEITNDVGTFISETDDG
jgi:hypothetical protein